LDVYAWKGLKMNERSEARDGPSREVELEEDGHRKIYQKSSEGSKEPVARRWPGERELNKSRRKKEEIGRGEKGDSTQG